MRFIIIALTALAAVFVVFGLPMMDKPATPSESARLARPSPSVPQSPTPAAPDWAATANAADAQARYVAGQTATAQWAQQATATARMGATVQAVTLQWADVMQRQTQAALTVTLQAVQAAQATGTYSAGAATASATAAIPAMTATREAQQVQREEQSRNSWVWLGATVTAFLIFVCALTFSISRYLASLGVKAEADAYRTSSQVMPPIIARQEPGPGRKGYVVIMVREKPIVTELPALADNQPAPVLAAETPRPHMTKAQAELIAFVKDAQRALARARNFTDGALAFLAVTASVAVSATYNYTQVAQAAAALQISQWELVMLALGPLVALVFLSLNFGRVLRAHEQAVTEWHKAQSTTAANEAATKARAEDNARYDAQRAAEREAQRRHELALAELQAKAQAVQFANAAQSTRKADDSATQGNAQPGAIPPQPRPARGQSRAAVLALMAQYPNHTNAQYAAALGIDPAQVTRALKEK